MKFKLARVEGEGWKAYKYREPVPDGAEVKTVDAEEIFKNPKSWEAIDFCEAVLRRAYRHVVTSNENDLSDVAYSLGNRAYCKQLNRDVEHIVEDVKSGDIKDREGLLERVYNECESAVMYMRASHEIMLYTDHFEYGFDEGFICTERERPGRDEPDLVTQIAYWAYYGDLMDRLSRAEGIDIDEEDLGQEANEEEEGST